MREADVDPQYYTDIKDMEIHPTGEEWEVLPVNEPAEEPIQIPEPEREPEKVPADARAARRVIGEAEPKVGELDGYRYGLPRRDAEGNWKIHSPSYDMDWGRGTVTASSDHCPSGAKGHRAPEPGHSCGLYTRHDEARIVSEFGADKFVTHVKLWGRVLPGTDGYKAEKARIASIRTPQCSTCDKPATKLEVVSHAKRFQPDPGESADVSMIRRHMLLSAPPEDLGEVDQGTPVCDDHHLSVPGERKRREGTLTDAPRGSHCVYWRCNASAVAYLHGLDRGVGPGPRCPEHLPVTTVAGARGTVPMAHVAKGLADFYGVPVIGQGETRPRVASSAEDMKLSWCEKCMRYLGPMESHDDAAHARVEGERERQKLTEGITSTKDTGFLPKDFKDDGESVALHKRWVTNNGPVAYHGTHALNKVLSEGIKTPQQLGAPTPTDDDYDRMDVPYLHDGVYLGTRERVRDFAGDDEGGHVVTVDVKPYKHHIYDNTDEDLIVVGGVHPDHITHDPAECGCGKKTSAAKCPRCGSPKDDGDCVVCGLDGGHQQAWEDTLEDLGLDEVALQDAQTERRLNTQPPFRGRDSARATPVCGTCLGGGAVRTHMAHPLEGHSLAICPTCGGSGARTSAAVPLELGKSPSLMGDVSGRPIKLVGKGNEKLGANVYHTNLPDGESCPGASSWCQSNCYAAKGFYTWKSNVDKYADNHQLLRENPDGYEEQLHGEVSKLKPGSVFRIHTSGDFESAQHVKVWQRVAARNPHVQFYGYTRSWAVPGIRKHLEKFKAQPNVELWASSDETMGKVPAGWREAKVFDHADAARSGGFGTVCPEQQCVTCGHGPEHESHAKKPHRDLPRDQWPEPPEGKHHHVPKRDSCSSCGLCWKAKEGAKLAFVAH